jgi:small subunit ribosomal protein S20
LSGSKSLNRAARAQETKRLRNRVLRGKTRTLLRQARQSVAAGDADTMQATAAVAVSGLDRAVTKGLYHKNKAARLKSRLSKSVNAKLPESQSA